MESLKVGSAQDIVDRLKGVTTQLFRHLRVEMVDSVEDIRFLGIQYTDDIGHENAIVKLLSRLDDELFHGNPSKDERCIRGLRSQLGSDSLYTSNYYTADRREAFFDRFEADKSKYNLRLFSPTRAHAIGEGDLPDDADTFAIGMDALVWKQLMPCTIIPLVPLREGKCARSITPDPVTFKHETSTEQPRSAALIYGQLHIANPNAVFMLGR